MNSTSTLSTKQVTVPKCSVTNCSSYFKKKCIDDLKSFNTSLIKYQSEGTGGTVNGKGTRATHTPSPNSDLNMPAEDVINVSYIVQQCPMNLMPPNQTHNNNNNITDNAHIYNKRFNGKILSVPHVDEVGDNYGRCCNSVGEYVNHGKNATSYTSSYGRNSLSNKFSNSSPSLFYGNGHNHNNNKQKYYSASHTKDKKRTFTVTDIDKRVYGLTERFAGRAYLLHIPNDHPELVHNDHFDTLNRRIWEVFSAKAQTQVTYLRKLEFWKMVYLSLQPVMDRYGLFLVGSTMSGLGLDTSDIDMCLLVRPMMLDPRSDALSYLQNVCHLLGSCDFITRPEVIMAKVPILKFRDATFGFQVDLNCNNSVGIRNTHLLNAYARLDWRVRPLVVIVKVWAQANGINDAKRMTINSYSLALMTLHYLQCGVSPPAIPCLQALYPERFRSSAEIHSLDFDEELPPYYSDNKQSLGELLLGFLHYFTHFNYSEYAMSVREGRLLAKKVCRLVRAPKNDATQWKLLCIEEPFEKTNTARCVYDVSMFEFIRSVFRVSYETLVKQKDLAAIVPLAQLPPVQMIPLHSGSDAISPVNNASQS